MAKKTDLIETGVDRLVSLINSRKRVSINEAAKLLGVSTSVIEEWSDFLEEEGVISLEYKLATTYLVERRLSKKEVQKKAKEFHGSKDAFIRNVETTISSIETDVKSIEGLKKEFYDLKKEIGSDLENVNDELKELESYEQAKKDIDKELMKEQERFKNRLTEIDREILKEKQKYQDILDDIEMEKVKLQEERTELVNLREQERRLHTKLGEFISMVNKLRDQIDSEEDKVGLTEDHIDKLDDKAKRLKSEVEDHKKRIDPLVVQSKDFQQKIIRQQREILEKVMEHKEDIEDSVAKGKKLADSFRKFFDKKSRVEGLVKKIDTDSHGLKEEFNKLIKKAQAFNVTTKDSSVKKHMAELEDNFKSVEKKREQFKKDLKSLADYIKKSF